MSTRSTNPDDELLRTAGLRCTPARRHVLSALRREGRPVAHKDLAEALPALDRATVFRNLVALVDAGLAHKTDPGDRVWRYVFTGPAARPADHGHPHFTCVSCGETTCMDEVVVQIAPRRAAMLEGAEIQIRGTCGTCR